MVSAATYLQTGSSMPVPACFSSAVTELTAVSREYALAERKLKLKPAAWPQIRGQFEALSSCELAQFPI